jgi:hypothetical protein
MNRLIIIIFIEAIFAILSAASSSFHTSWTMDYGSSAGYGSSWSERQQHYNAIKRALWSTRRTHWPVATRNDVVLLTRFDVVEFSGVSSLNKRSSYELVTTTSIRYRKHQNNRHRNMVLIRCRFDVPYYMLYCTI